MQPTSDTDYKSLFSQLIKKQMLVLGPDITLAKVRNVTGLTVDINGDVQKIDGDPQMMLQSLINQFVELSGMIVKKTMESILTSYPGMMAMAATTAFGGTQPVQASTQTTKPTVSIDTSASQQPVEIKTPQPAVEDKPVSTPVEPPSMASISLDSLNQAPKEEKKPEEPKSFSNQEMADLNKALEELSKAPLSTEKPTA